MKLSKRLLAGLLIILLIASLLSAASAEKEISVKFTFDKTSYQVGKKITVQYTLSGGSGSFPTVYYTCYSIDNGQLVNVKDGSFSSGSGTITFTPSIGQKAYVTMSGFDSKDRFFTFNSDYVQLKGGQDTQPISVKFNFSKTSYTLGKKITVDYALSGGSGSFPTVYYTCYSIDNGQLVNVKNGSFSSGSGTITFTPSIGQKAYVTMSGFDSQNRFFTFDSDYVKLKGGQDTQPISVKFTFGKASYTLGKKITVQYALSGGSGSFPTVYYTCYSIDNGQLVSVKNGYFSSGSGTITFTPSIGQKAYVTMSGFDSKDRFFTFDSDYVKLKPTSISSATVSTIKSQVYTGKAIKPKPAITLSGKTLTNGTDYKLSYKNNKNIGTATVTITGIGKYTGTLTTTFKIIPKPVTLSLSAGVQKVTAKWSKVSGITGYQIVYSLKKDFSNSKTITITNTEAVKRAIKDLKSNKTYYVRMRTYKTVSGKNYYSAWSKALSAKTK